MFSQFKNLITVLILTFAGILMDWNFNTFLINAESNKNNTTNGTNEAKFITGVQCRYWEHKCKAHVLDDDSTKQCCFGNVTCRRYIKDLRRRVGVNVCVVRSKGMEKKIKDCCVGMGKQKCSVYFGENIVVREELMDLDMRKPCV